MSEADDEYDFDDTEYRDDADRAYAELLARVGEQAPQPRLDATRRVVELLGDPHRAYPVVHITGTNGKTSTSRMIESILRAYGLRTGLLTSPHLVRPNERIVIDGAAISNRAFAANWVDVRPYIEIIDAELRSEGQEPLTFFEAFTVLAFAAFADAPVDVAVVEVGMGGEWDSTNVADGQVAVITPIALDHVQRLGSTVQQIARTKAGIIKPLASVVSAAQEAEALAELVRASELTESRLAVENDQFSLVDSTLAVGGQVITVQGLAGRYEEVFLPLYGAHQGHNAAVAVAAVESFLGQGTQALAEDVLAEGLGSVTSPGRLQLVGTEPTVLVDAAHNPHGARALAEAMTTAFAFDEIAIVLGVLRDKDADGILEAIAPVASAFFVSQSASDRAVPADELADLVRDHAPARGVEVFETLEFAVQDARVWASQAPRRAVLVTGSITVIGEVIALSEAEGWK